mgnify:CR=1 FL=1
MSRWIFLRHGESVANAEGWLAGHRDAALTDKGARQARSVRKPIAATRPARAFCSDLIRAQKTAEIALDGLGIHLIVAPALRERSLGDWEGADKAALRSSGDLQIALTVAGRPPGGESLGDVARRATAFLNSIDDGSGPTLIVAHGGLIRVVLGLLDGMPRPQIGTWNIANAEILIRDVELGGWGILQP